jgi:RNA polymerase sigma-70 factor (ECF subfamily)
LRGGMRNVDTTIPNGEALTGAFTALRDRLLGTAYLVLGHREDAREAVQDAFVKCWRRRETVVLSTMDAWIFSVLLNAARDLRRRRAIRRTAALPGEEIMPSGREEDPPAALLKREQRARLRAALGDLPEREREVFVLRQNGDLTYAAIAEVVGAPVGTVKTRMRSALARLRGVLLESVPMEPKP